MNCCDDYGNCNQGRNCPARETRQCTYCFGIGYDASGQRCSCAEPARVARIGRKDYGREPYGPSLLPRYLKHLAKWMLIVVGMLIAACIWLPLIMAPAAFAPSKQLVDCSMASFHPDFTPAMREACRKRKATP